MFCPNCGKKVKKDTQKFCTYCGTKLFKPKTNDIEEQKKEVTEKTQEQVECVINNEVAESTQEVESNKNNDSSVNRETIAVEEQDTTVVIEQSAEDEITENQTQVAIEESNDVATNEPSVDDIDTHSDSLPEENTYIENDIEEYKEETTYRNSALQRWAKEEREEREKINRVKSLLYKNKFIILSFLICIIIVGLVIAYAQFPVKNKTSKQSDTKEKVATVLKKYDLTPNQFVDWYKVDNDTFIDVYGNKVFKLNEHYDFIGEFSENILVVGKQLNKEPEFCGMDCTWLYEITLINNKGEVLSKIPQILIYDDGYSNPIFHNGILTLNQKNNDKPIYVNKDGKIVKKPKDYEEYDANKEYHIGSRDFYSTSEYPMDKNGPYPYTSWCRFKDCDSCVSYRFENSSPNSDLSGKFCIMGPSEDLSRDQHFYNGVAMVSEDFQVSNRRYIDNKGHYINNEKYEYGYPFWRKLTYVVRADGQRGFINTKGKWVYKF